MSVWVSVSASVSNDRWRYMHESTFAQLADHVAVGQRVLALAPEVDRIAEVLKSVFRAGGTVFTLGNGGSASDAQHFTGELIGHYKRDRRPLPAVTLGSDSTTMTCIANDYAFADVFSRQVTALAGNRDAVVAFTTSGTSPNVVLALQAAQANGAITILFGGGDGGTALAHADYALLSPSTLTPRIQEAHTLFLHAISESLDAWAAGEESNA